ncbi:hypothetical protein [Streptomyces sp. PTD5-9]|uniref:hypothetical protein n=1 Tax=Streptomyces sp. PTD5-9 TaxID=3120150 RepID=UPI003009256B
MAYQTLRAHTQGGDRRLTYVDPARHARERRQRRGRVARALLSAITVMVQNIEELGQYLAVSEKSTINGLKPNDALLPYRALRIQRRDPGQMVTI